MANQEESMPSQSFFHINVGNLIPIKHKSRYKSTSQQVLLFPPEDRCHIHVIPPCRSGGGRLLLKIIE
jgi:hypothetical protein